MSTSENDSLGSRMKGYEYTTRHTVLRRMPVIIRLDGRAFHSFVKCLKYFDYTLVDTPFSILMHKVMMQTAVQCVKQIQNAVFAYTQSDEISILLRDWNTHETQQWFDAVVQKMCSISAALASVHFNDIFSNETSHINTSAQWPLVQFDSRVFNLPKEEVCNYFIWRQLDASRNSVQMLGHYYFSQTQMQLKTNSQVQDMLMLNKKINWNDINTWKKRGSCVYQKTNVGLIPDEDIPIFSQDRNYIEQHLEI
jgi:tRNA(His) 5'-end guanylyltransferase